MAAVDVGIVTYNTCDVTVPAVRRLLEVAPQGTRILVHDNASSDGTVAALRALGPSVEVVAHPENLGFGAGMNRILERSTAPWFLCLNSDAWPEPGAIERLLEVGERHPRVALVAPRLVKPDDTLEESVHPFPSLAIAAMTATGMHRRLFPRATRELPLPGGFAHDEAREVPWVVAAAWLMRREAIDAVGGFDESFFMYAEDLEWCWRAREAGWAIRFEPSAVVRHLWNSSGAKAFGARRSRAHIHNEYRFYRRSHSAAETATYRLVSLVGTGRLYLASVLRKDHAGRAHWAGHVRAHASRVRPTERPGAAATSGGLTPRAWAARRREVRRQVDRLCNPPPPHRFGAFGSSLLVPPSRVSRPDLIHVGDDVLVHEHSWFSVVHHFPDLVPRLELHDHVRVGRGCQFSVAQEVVVERGAVIGDFVQIGDTYHPLEAEDRMAELVPPQPVRIGAGAVIGGHAVILPGVTVGAGAYVDHHTVVHLDVPAGGYVSGHPARLRAAAEAS